VLIVGRPFGADNLHLRPTAGAYSTTEPCSASSMRLVPEMLKQSGPRSRKRAKSRGRIPKAMRLISSCIFALRGLNCCKLLGGTAGTGC
jgi:hypothetical protein